MARIVYKEGLEGQNRLECIEGIEIELLNGQKALIFPMYDDRQLLSKECIWRWNVPVESEFEGLKRTTNEEETQRLLELGSPAADWVSYYKMGHQQFGLPTMLAAMEILSQMEEIDALAETIKGADLLRDYSIHMWTCSRGGQSTEWIATGDSNSFYDPHISLRCLSVPVILL